MWFERQFTFKLGPHLLRGRVDRVDRLPGGEYELIDYKTGRPKSAAQLADDVQLSLYAVGAREAWSLEASRQAYYYLLDDEKVTVPADDGDRAEWIRGVAHRGRRGDPLAGLRADAVVRGVLALRLPAGLPGGRALTRWLDHGGGALTRWLAPPAPGDSSSPRWRRKRCRSRAIVSPDGQRSGLVLARSRPPARAVRQRPARRGRSARRG